MGGGYRITSVCVLGYSEFVVAVIGILASSSSLGFFLCFTTHTIQQTSPIETTTLTTMAIISIAEEAGNK